MIDSYKCSRWHQVSGARRSARMFAPALPALQLARFPFVHIVNSPDEAPVHHGLRCRNAS